MSVALGTTFTLAEMIRRESPAGELARIVNVLSQVNAIGQDSTWVPCNNGTYHEDTRRASEPSGGERAYNQGVTSEAGVTEKVTEPTCMFCGLSEVDAKIFQHSPNPIQARADEDAFFLDGLFKQHVSRLFDGSNAADPLQIDGINNRSDYNALSSDYVYDTAGGSCADDTVFTSIYIIQWGYKKVNLIYPRNDPNRGGALPIKREDYGKDLITDSDNSSAKFPAYRTWFEVDFGLFIHDPRCIKRICNIATSSIDGATYYSFDEDVMIDAYNDLEYGGEGAVIYCNRTVKAQMQKRANEKGNASFTQAVEGEGPFAKPVLRWWGIPVREVAQITNTQADVT